MLFAATIAIAVLAASSAQALSQCPQNVRCRYEWESLSDEQKDRYIKAVKAMQHDRNTYMNFAHKHADNNGKWHGGPWFSPAHRKMLADYEKELLSIDSQVIIPYWDWTKYSSDMRKSPIWNWFGKVDSNGCATAPFDNWKDSADSSVKCLRRNVSFFDSGSPKNLWTSEEMQRIVQDDTDYFNFEAALENRHGAVHVHFGDNSDMKAMPSSPRDPIFFVHHMFTDKLWNDWQLGNPEKRLMAYNGKDVSLDDEIPGYSGTKVRDVMDTLKMGYAYVDAGVKPPSGADEQSHDTDDQSQKEEEQKQKQKQREQEEQDEQQGNQEGEQSDQSDQSDQQSRQSEDGKQQEQQPNGQEQQNGIDKQSSTTSSTNLTRETPAANSNSDAAKRNGTTKGNTDKDNGRHNASHDRDYSQNPKNAVSKTANGSALTVFLAILLLISI